MWKKGLIKNIQYSSKIVSLVDFLHKTTDWSKPIYGKVAKDSNGFIMKYFDVIPSENCDKYIHKKRLSDGVYRLTELQKMIHTCTLEYDALFVSSYSRFRTKFGKFGQKTGKLKTCLAIFSSCCILK